MISKYRVTQPSDAHGLPPHIRKVELNLPPAHLAAYFDPYAPHAQQTVTTKHIDLKLTSFRSSVSYTLREMHSRAHLPLSQLFHDMLEFCEWLKQHPTYEYCGSFVTNHSEPSLYGEKFTFTAIAYVCGENADNTDDIYNREYKNRIPSHIGTPAMRMKQLDAELEKMLSRNAKQPIPKPKPVVTFNQALDMAKELGR